MRQKIFFEQKSTKGFWIFFDFSIDKRRKIVYNTTMQYNCVNYGDIMPFLRDATQKLAEITYFSTIFREFCYINIYSRKKIHKNLKNPR